MLALSAFQKIFVTSVEANFVYILHAIQDSSLFDVVHVSTDSTEIASIAEAEDFS